jgi:hypothetical protein
MSHFTSKEKLKAFLNADQVTALFSKIPTEEQDQHFTYTDSKITAKTGVAPAETNHAILVSIASRIVIWFLSGAQQWNVDNKPELDRREKLYTAALSELDALTPQDIGVESSDNNVGPAFHASHRRVRSW